MIVVRMKGGLGNQMFQYAAGRRLALRRGTDLRLDVSFHLKERGNATPRPFLLDRFNIAGSLIEGRELMDYMDRDLPWYKRPLNWAAYAWTKDWVLESPRAFVERDQNFEPTVLDLPDGTYLSGYFQTERYFADIGEQLKKELTVRSPMDARNEEMAERIAEEGSVCLHVRRGDYYSNEACRSVHAVDLTDYYSKAISLLRSRAEGLHFFIFSDEPDWVRRHFGLGDDCTVVAVNGPDEPEQDLRLMSLCRHFIIANSSFSWWGAWLSTNPDKVVIAPQRWFLDDRNVKDRCPDSWIRL